MDLDTGIGRGMLEIAFALMSIALIALLLNRSSDTVKVLGSVTSNFNTLLNTVMLTGNTGVGRVGGMYGI